ncbi:MAG: biotin--[acetyl-CoA-carboxylase] ligase, partial [Clostridiaceae bacterium]
MMKADRINELLKTSALGRNAAFLESVDSTNLEAKRMARFGCPHGQLVVSEHQMQGRGRRGRQWSDEAGKSVCMSLVLRPNVAPELAPRYPLAAALGLYEALLSFGIAAGIKWPNDLLF